MAQIGSINLQTESSGVVTLPVFELGDSGGNVYEFVRVQTDTGVGFIPFTNINDAAYPYVRVRSENNGILAVHDSATTVATLQNTYTYTTSGSNQVTIDQNAQYIKVTVRGAGGANGTASTQGDSGDFNASTSNGANGGEVVAEIPVNGGETLHSYVGGSGSSGGFNGGGNGPGTNYSPTFSQLADFSVSAGNGGGASDIRLNGDTLADRIVSAGGGGGGGAACYADQFGASSGDVSSGGGGAGAGNSTANDGGDTASQFATGGTGGGQADETGGDGAYQDDYNDFDNDTNNDTDAAVVGCGGGGGGGQTGGDGGGANAGGTEAHGAGGGGGDGEVNTTTNSLSTTTGGGESGDGYIKIEVYA